MVHLQYESTAELKKVGDILKKRLWAKSIQQSIFWVGQLTELRFQPMCLIL